MKKFVLLFFVLFGFIFGVSFAEEQPVAFNEEFNLSEADFDAGSFFIDVEGIRNSGIKPILDESKSKVYASISDSGIQFGGELKRNEEGEEEIVITEEAIILRNIIDGTQSVLVFGSANKFIMKGTFNSEEIGKVAEKIKTYVPEMEQKTIAEGTVYSKENHGCLVNKNLIVFGETGKLKDIVAEAAVAEQQLKKSIRGRLLLVGYFSHAEPKIGNPYRNMSFIMYEEDKTTVFDVTVEMSDQKEAEKCYQRITASVGRYAELVKPYSPDFAEALKKLSIKTEDNRISLTLSQKSDLVVGSFKKLFEKPTE